MSQNQQLIDEIKNEAESTLKLLEIIPVDKFDWRPHEKSQSVKQLATHIAGLSGMPGLILNTPYLDFMENKGPKPEINNTEDIVQYHKKGIEDSIVALEKAGEAEMNANWTMKAGDHIIVEAPRTVVMRKMAMSHLYHHRGQLSVYLRLLNIPIPGMYGPSADDKA